MKFNPLFCKRVFTLFNLIKSYGPVFFISLYSVFSGLSLAQSQENPQGVLTQTKTVSAGPVGLDVISKDHPRYEPYSLRPSILNIEAKPLKDRSPFVAQYQKASLLFVSFLLKFYENSHLYFLARDAEFFYDIAQLLEPQSKRIHLINISRESVNSKQLKSYLESQQFFTRLNQGQRSVLVDTGYFGSIPNRLLRLLTTEQKALVKTHLAASENVLIPSSLVFLSQIRKNEQTALLPSALHPIIEEYEHELPHYTDRAVDYKWILEWNRLEPVSPIHEAEGGLISKSMHIELMQDLKWLIQNHYGQNLFKISHFISQLKGGLDQGDQKALKQLLYGLGRPSLIPDGPLEFNESLIKEALFLDVVFSSKEHRGLLSPYEVLSADSPFRPWLDKKAHENMERHFSSGSLDFNLKVERLLKAQSGRDLADLMSVQAENKNPLLMKYMGDILFTAEKSEFVSDMQLLYLSFCRIDHLEYLAALVFPKLPDLGGSKMLEAFFNQSKKFTNGHHPLTSLVQSAFRKPQAQSYHGLLRRIHLAYPDSRVLNLEILKVLLEYFEVPEYQVLLFDILDASITEKRFQALEFYIEFIFPRLGGDFLSSRIHSIIGLNDKYLNALLLRWLGNHPIYAKDLEVLKTKSQSFLSSRLGPSGKDEIKGQAINQNEKSCENWFLKDI